MQISKIVIASLGALCVQHAVAGTMGPVSTPRVFTLSVGPAWYSAGETQTLNINPGVFRTYTADDQSRVLAFGELFYGCNHVLSNMVTGQLGLALAATSDAEIKGDVWDSGLPTLNNATYKYNVNHARVALKGKLVAEMGQFVMPYVSASVGVGFNHAHAFTNTPRVFGISEPNFQSNTDVAFAYTAGAGLEHALTQNWRVGAGYEFSDWGQSQLDAALGQTLGEGLSLDNLYTHALALSVSYVG